MTKAPPEDTVRVFCILVVPLTSNLKPESVCVPIIKFPPNGRIDKLPTELSPVLPTEIIPFVLPVLAFVLKKTILPVDVAFEKSVVETAIVPVL